MVCDTYLISPPLPPRSHTLRGPHLPLGGRLSGSSPCQMGNARVRDQIRGPSGTPVPTELQARDRWECGRMTDILPYGYGTRSKKDSPQISGESLAFGFLTSAPSRGACASFPSYAGVIHMSAKIIIKMKIAKGRTTFNKTEHRETIKAIRLV